jgi:hypothetical protein
VKDCVEAKKKKKKKDERYEPAYALQQVRLVAKARKLEVVRSGRTHKIQEDEKIMLWILMA